jgi:hypothetical protein
MKQMLNHDIGERLKLNKDMKNSVFKHVNRPIAIETTAVDRSPLKKSNRDHLGHSKKQVTSLSTLKNHFTAHLTLDESARIPRVIIIYRSQ